MFQKCSNRVVYFSTDIIELVELDNTFGSMYQIEFSKDIITNYELLVNENNMPSNDCHLMFDGKYFSKALKLSRALQNRQRARKLDMKRPKQNADPSFTIFSNTQANNYIFYTQNDGNYFTQAHHSANKIDPLFERSQYMRLNSILDALEQTGYYGFVTFVACVQCVKLNGSLSLFLSETQKTQVTQSAMQFRMQNSGTLAEN